MSTKHWNNKEDRYVLDDVHYLQTYTPLERVKAVAEYDDIRPDDVIVCGYPKSGNHFFADIVKKLRNKGDISKSVKEACDVFLESIVPDAAQYHPELTSPKSLDDISLLASPRVMNTHLYFEKLPRRARAGHCKIIHILRDPRDVACSWYNMELRTLQDLRKMNVETSVDISVSVHDCMKEFLSGTALYGSWYDHTKSYLNVGDAPHVLLVKYEETLMNMGEEIKKIAKFIGEDLSDDAISKVAESCRIENVKKIFPNSIFLHKGTVGTWKEYLTVAENEATKEKMVEKLNGFPKAIQMYLS